MTVQAATSALAPAAIGARVIASLIDFVILWIILSIVGGILSDVTIAGGFIRTIIAALVAFGYFVYSWTAWRATPGQRVLGLRTVNEADGAALTRNEATFFVALFMIGYYVYLIYSAATDPRKQGFHDRHSGTLVNAKLVA